MTAGPEQPGSKGSVGAERGGNVVRDVCIRIWWQHVVPMAVGHNFNQIEYRN